MCLNNPLFAMLTFDYSQFGCHLNALSVDELFDLYEMTGFIYPAKKAVIKPYCDIIAANWRAAIDAGLLRILSYDSTTAPPWALTTLWLHTTHGWNIQHLVSFGFGGPVASRAVLLCTGAASMDDPEDYSHQNFFQRKKRFANRVFGTIDKSLKSDACLIRDYSYLAFPKAKISSLEAHPMSDELCETDIVELQAFIESQRSSVFTNAEQINAESITLNNLNERYQSAGLFRYRKICVFHQDDQILGCALAYRGPLGLNFSLLENRCELIIKKNLSKNCAFIVANALLKQAAHYYKSFEPDCLYILTNIQNQALLEQLGSRFLRLYTQGIWTHSGYQNWYDHVEQIYEPVMRAYNRRNDRQGN